MEGQRKRGGMSPYSRAKGLTFAQFLLTNLALFTLHDATL